MELFQVISLVVAVCLVLIRQIPKLEPLIGFLPAKWRWLPPAGATVVGLLSTMDPSNIEQAAGVVITAVVFLILAAQKGLKDE